MLVLLRSLGVVVLSAVLLSLAACGMPTRYQPAVVYGDGFSEQQLEANRFRVTFTGNSLTPRDRVENYLLFRAAEITLQSGHDYFVVVDLQTDASTTYRTSFDGRPDYGYYRRHRYYPPPYYGSGFASTDAFTSYTAYAVIVVFSGQKPTTDVKAFDARDLVQNLGPQIVRP